MRPLDTLIFDLDGTLGETMPVCFRAFRSTILEHLGRVLSDEEILAHFGPSEEGILRRLLPERAEEALETYLRAYAAEHESCPAPFPGIPELLDEADEAGFRLLLVTAKGPRSCALSLARLGLEGRFEQVAAGHPEGNRKHENIAWVLREAGLSAEVAAYVGDAPSDVPAARRAGVLALSVAWAGSADPERLRVEEPDALFHEVEELREWLARVPPGSGRTRRRS